MKNFFIFLIILCLALEAFISYLLLLEKINLSNFILTSVTNSLIIICSVLNVKKIIEKGSK